MKARLHRRHAVPASQVIVVPKTPPTAEIKGPYSGTAPATVVFDYSTSFDPEGNGVYDWFLEPGAGFQQRTGMGQAPFTISQTYTAPGNYAVQFWVVSRSSNLKSNVDTTTVNVQAAPQVVDSVTLDKATATGTAGNSVVLTATAKDGTTVVSRPFSWRSDNPSAASVPNSTAAQITVNLVAQGTAKIYAKCETTVGSGVFVESVPCTVTVTAQTGTPTWNGDFETGNLSQYGTVQRCGTDRIIVYTATSQPTWPTPAQGTYAVRFRPLSTDINGCGSPTENPRAQLMSPFVLKQGSEYWCKFRVFFPNDFPAWQTNCFFDFQSIYGLKCPNMTIGPGLSHFALIGNASTGVITNIIYTDQIYKGPFTKNQWIKFMVHLKLSKDPAIGFTEIFRDGVIQTLSNGQTRMNRQTVNDGICGDLDTHINAYFRHDTWASVTTYMDDHKIGPTRASIGE